MATDQQRAAAIEDARTECDQCGESFKRDFVTCPLCGGWTDDERRLMDS